MDERCPGEAAWKARPAGRVAQPDSLSYETSGCGSGLVVGPNTSCGFAENVRAEYNRSGVGWINVYSPATRRTYDIFCTSSSPHVCTGGNNAAVYCP